MPRHKLNDYQLRDFAAEHLTYEVDMLLATALLLGTGNHELPMKNALLESFTIHLRALIDFLWESDNPRPDDAIATDYYASTDKWHRVRPVFPTALDPARKRTAKEIVHLTYTRLTVTTEQKRWNYFDMANAITEALVEFRTNALPSRIGDALLDLKRLGN